MSDGSEADVVQYFKNSTINSSFNCLSKDWQLHYAKMHLRHAGAPNSAKCRGGGLQRASQNSTKGGCNNFLLFTI